MCGLVILHGIRAAERMPSALARLQHRGPDDLHQWNNAEGSISIGFTRLAINDFTTAGRQPYSHNDFVGAFNGEIYNFKDLINRFHLTNIDYCDTHVILPLFSKIGSQILRELDGFYSGIIHDKSNGSLLLVRDHIGKKPLFYGKSEGQIFITSELKVFDTIDWFEQAPLGISRLDLSSGQLTCISTHSFEPQKAELPLFDALTQAVQKRLPQPGQPTGLFLSGGLDSSIICAITKRYRDDVIHYVLGNADSDDQKMVHRLASHLQLENIRYVPLPTSDELPKLIQQVVRATESYNPSIVSNGLATFLLAREANKDGIKVVLTGEGADELFAGYHSVLSKSLWQETQTQLINDMRFTELRRLDTCSMAHSVEARCPFLDQDVRNIAETLPFEDYFSNGTNKVALRHHFGHLLPDEIASRKKTSFDVGSGIRGLVVSYLHSQRATEKEALQELWEQEYRFDHDLPYFHSYPVFDEAIAKRGAQHR